MVPSLMREYSVPAADDDGWTTAALTSVGIDPKPIAELLARVESGRFPNTHSVLLVKDGLLVLDEYFSGLYARGQRPDEQAAIVDFDRFKKHSLHSVTKSVNSMLIGIAIDEGLIEGVDQKVADFFPQWPELFTGAKADITLGHFLSMTAGLRWDEHTYPYTDSRNDHVGLLLSADQARFTLELPVVAEPGTTFVYNSGISITLGEILHRASGRRADDFAAQFLFAPLGISDYFWTRFPSGIVQTGGGLHIRPRDMAKLGALFLNGGRWRGDQIVSEAWVSESTRQQARDFAYGYQWWLDAQDGAVLVYSAEGRGGQFIIVIPGANAVAVITAWNDNELQYQPRAMLRDFIAPALAPATVDAVTKFLATLPTEHS